MKRKIIASTDHTIFQDVWIVEEKENFILEGQYTIFYDRESALEYKESSNAPEVYIHSGRIIQKY